ncbi:unnamed protein product [Urochloa humidicola]
MTGSVGGGADDRISSLPDHLLHTIVLRLRDIAAAARTSALSRRWRRVWLHLPELSFPFRCAAGAHIYWRESDKHRRRVDAALAAHAAPTVTLLDVALPRWVPAPRQYPEDPNRDDPLLRFLASRRVAGELRLTLRGSWYDVVLPPCERATAISLNFNGLVLRFQQPHPAAGSGAFAALASLRIKRARVDARELGEVLFSRCPNLKELFLKRITLKDQDNNVLSIRSDSLERLEMDMCAGFDARVEVFAPRMKVFVSRRISGGDARIVAPRLLELCWHGWFDPARHDLGEAGRHLQRLEIAKNSPAAQLIRQFYSIHELQLTLQVWEGIHEYDRYLKAINRLPNKCEVLMVGFVVTQHAIKPVILHFLNKCAGAKKIVVRTLGYRMDKCQCKSWECQCDGSKQQSPKIDDTALCSLELVEIKEDMEAYHKVEFVKLLCEYSASFQKKVTINVIENKQSVREKICSIRVPNDKVVINVNIRSTQAET